jgi:hypothetical protein
VTNNYFRINAHGADHYVFFDGHAEMSCIGAYAQARNIAGNHGTIVAWLPMPFPGPWESGTVRYVGMPGRASREWLEGHHVA